MPRGEFDRSERRARTRAQLLEAAARVYARRGFEGATLDAVADEAGFTKGAVYDHFGSKENLLFALLDEHLSAQIAEQIKTLRASQTIEVAPQRTAKRQISAQEPVTSVIRRRVEETVDSADNESPGGMHQVRVVREKRTANGRV